MHPSLDYVRGFQDAREQAAEMVRALSPELAEAIYIMAPDGREEERLRAERVRRFMQRDAGYFTD